MKKILVGFLGSVVVLCGCGVVFYLTQYNHVKVKVSKETTFVTGPLNDDGSVDYLAAFLERQVSAELATDRNGFRQVIQEVDLREPFANRFDIICTKLGLDSSEVKPKLRYQKFEDFAKEYFESEEYDEKFIRKLSKEIDRLPLEEDEEVGEWKAKDVLISRATVPWTAKDLAMLVPWVEENSPVLDVFAKALQKDAFEIPFCNYENNESKIYLGEVGDEESAVTLFAWHFSSTSYFQKISQGFWVRANYYLGNGEFRKAIDDIVACKRLGRYLRNRCTSTDRSLGGSIEQLANHIGYALSSNDAVDIEDLDYLFEELDKLPPLVGVESVKFHERLNALAFLQKISRDPEFWLESGEEDEYSEIYKLGLDWNVVYREFNLTFDAIWEHHPDFPEEMGETKKLIRASQTISDDPDFEVTMWDKYSREARSKKFGKIMAASQHGAMLRMFDHEAQCMDNIYRIVLAMLRYEKEKGTLPPAFTTDKEGEPLHSWRVFILPYLGHQELYDQIRLDEPWNSTHNAELANNCPIVFGCPGCNKNSGMQTNYSVVLGEHTAFNGNKGKILDSLGKDSNDMILIAERRLPVHWMDPTQELSEKEALQGIGTYFDFRYKELPPIGSRHFIGAHFGLRNGRSMLFSGTIDRGVYKNLIRGTNTVIDFN